MKTEVKIGDDVYVGSSFYLSHGRDDFAGGKATVIGVKEAVSGGKPTVFIRFDACPASWYNWDILRAEQVGLKERFGEQKAHSDPDYREQFNRND